MTTVPFYDLAAVHAPLASELAQAVQRVIANNHLVLGPEGEALETEFAAFCGSVYGAGVGNGLDALKLGLLAMGIGPGDEVIVPGQTFIATWLAVSATGATPVPADVTLTTGQIDPAAVEAAITPRTAAIIAVHLFGALAPMRALQAIALRCGLGLVEDAAQAHGAGYGSDRAGSLADFAAFSFYPGKNLGALGDGGMVVTESAELADRVRMLRNYGSRRKYGHEVQGTNSRLDEIQAAVLRVKLPHLIAGNRRRRDVVARYRRALAGVHGVDQLEFEPGTESAAHLMPIRVADRGTLQARLAAAGIETGIHYPTPPHRTEAYARAARWPELPNSDQWAAQELSLPLGPALSDADADRVIAAVRAAQAGAADREAVFSLGATG